MSFPQVTADLSAYPEGGGGLTQAYARPAAYTADPTEYSGMEAASAADLIGRGRVLNEELPVAPNLGIGLDTAVGAADFTYLVALPPGYLIEPPPTANIATYRFYQAGSKGVIFAYEPDRAEAMFINRLGTFTPVAGGTVGPFTFIKVIARTLSGASLVLQSDAEQSGSIRCNGAGDVIYLELVWGNYHPAQPTIWGELQLRIDP